MNARVIPHRPVVLGFGTQGSPCLICKHPRYMHFTLRQRVARRLSDLKRWLIL